MSSEFQLELRKREEFRELKLTQLVSSKENFYNLERGQITIAVNPDKDNIPDYEMDIMSREEMQTYFYALGSLMTIYQSIGISGLINYVFKNLMVALSHEGKSLNFMTGIFDNCLEAMVKGVKRPTLDLLPEGTVTTYSGDESYRVDFESAAGDLNDSQLFNSLRKYVYNVVGLWGLGVFGEKTAGYYTHISSFDGRTPVWRMRFYLDPMTQTFEVTTVDINPPKEEEFMP